MSAFRMAVGMDVKMACIALALGASACGAEAAAPPLAAAAAAVTTEVALAAPDARACDLVLDVGGEPVNGVHFAEGVAGSHFRRAPLLAVSLTRLSDVPLPDAPFTIDAAVALHPRAVSVRCVDRLGHPIDGAALAAAEKDL